MILHRVRYLRLASILYLYCSTFYVSALGHGKLRGLNAFIEVEDIVLDGDYIILFEDNSSEITAMSGDDVVALASDLGEKYMLERKEIFTNALYGFTASNLTVNNLKDIQKDKRVLFVEKNGVISIEPIESSSSEDGVMNASSANITHFMSVDSIDKDFLTPMDFTRDEFIPPGVEKVGWHNAEKDDKVMSRRVFVVDSGVADLSSELNIDYSMARNFVSGERSTDWQDCNGHGTHVAGTIAAKKNGVGVVGVAAGAMIVPIRVLDCTGNGSIGDVVAGINYIAQNAWPGDVVNLSIGGPTDKRAMDVAIVKAAESTGAKFVVAAGNGSTNAEEYTPARAKGENIYTVCALSGNQRTVAGFSNYGKPPVDVCAPGSDVASLSIHGDISVRSGTSMAAPHVTGSLLFDALQTKGFAKSLNDGRRYPVIKSLDAR